MMAGAVSSITDILYIIAEGGLVPHVHKGESFSGIPVFHERQLQIVGV